MRWLTCLCILLSALLAGCSGPDGVPSGVLPREKMQQVLWDIIEADQYSLLYLAKDSAKINVKAETAGKYEQVFQLYKISRKEFEKSIRYYFSRPDIAKPLFDSLAAMGTRKRTEDYNHNKSTTPSKVTPPVNATPGKPPVPGPALPGHPVVPGKAPIPAAGHSPVPGHAPVRYNPGGNPPGHIPGTVSKPAPPGRRPGSTSILPKKTPVRKTSDTTRRIIHTVSGALPGGSTPKPK